MVYALVTFPMFFFYTSLFSLDTSLFACVVPIVCRFIYRLYPILNITQQTQINTVQYITDVF